MFDEIKPRVFSKIEDPLKDARCYMTMCNPSATRGDRVGLVYTLFSYGYSLHEVCSLIHNNNLWIGYEQDVTFAIIRNLYTDWQHKNNQSRTENKQSQTCYSSSVLPSNYEELKKLFYSNVMVLPRLDVPKDRDQAAWFYYNLGYHVVPKDPKGKYPSVAWKQYQDAKPGVLQMTKWDWSNGLCLLAANGFCFLDIDQKVTDPDFGHFERTPRGGLHIFAKGSPENMKITGLGEIKGKGTLIVSYPSDGYIIRCE